MPRRRFGTFAGGIDLPEEKHFTLDSPIAAWTPHLLMAPLAFVPGGHEAEAVVSIGQRVQAGEKIAVASAGRGVDMFAPVAATVSGFGQAAVAKTDGFGIVNAIELTELEPLSLVHAGGSAAAWQDYSAEELRRSLRQSGICMHTHLAEGLWQVADSARQKGCATVIANVMESEPYVTADHRLLVEHGRAVTEGLAIISSAVGAREIILAVDNRRTDDYRRIVSGAEQHSVQLLALPHKYPIGVDRILVHVLRAKEAPLNKLPTDNGVLVVDAATCLAAYRWVALKQRSTARVVTVSGELAGRRGNFVAPFGTPCESLLEAQHGPLLHGGAMRGFVCEAGAVVTPLTNALLAIEQQQARAPTPCIRCGWCTDHCPARLNVAALNDAFELGRIDLARKLGATASVECGVCSYVCPARLPLSQRVRRLKNIIRGPQRQNEQRT